MAARRWLYGALIACVAGCAQSNAQDSPASDAGTAPALTVRTAAVVAPSGQRRLTLLATAKTDENRVAIVTSPVSGKIRRLHVSEGDSVKRGQALAELESQVFAQAELDYLKALSEWRFQQKQRDRDAELKQKGALSGDELRQADYALAKAAADLSAAEAQLRIYHGGDADVARLKASGNVRGTLTLRAPIGGRVLERAVRLGEAVPPERGLMTVADHAQLWVLARVPEPDLPLVRGAKEATVRFKAVPGRPYQGQLVHFHDALDPKTRTLELKLAVANPDHRLRPEMFATVELPVQGETAGAVMPRTALQAAPEGDVAVVAKGGDQYELRAVKVLESLDGNRLRIDGLEPGEQVVTDGAQTIKAKLMGLTGAEEE